MLPEKLIKSKKRVKEFGEVFTPEHIVKQMCDLCEPDISDITKKIFEPTCGNGNFLVEILRRKLSNIKYKNKQQFEFEIILALSNIYAVDIQADNVKESKDRMRKIVFDFTKQRRSSKELLFAIDLVLDRTILLGNTLTEKDKLVFYDFKPNYEDLTFEISPHSLKEVEEYFLKTKKTNLKELKQAIEKIEAPPEKIKHKSKSTNKPSKEIKDDNSIQQIKLF